MATLQESNLLRVGHLLNISPTISHCCQSNRSRPIRKPNQCRTADAIYTSCGSGKQSQITAPRERNVRQS
ncbi:hypothetical protein DPX16_3145 [Anabarilius grahami]|uniref:Uncharacterized protein n=1 Tax=Anabarilius grahami TaxID=495550 RepID=A0A3N0YYT8_ANAGA|nr:hypothetical protein DPX16_3145 [Anabarilius grahami]